MSEMKRPYGDNVESEADAPPSYPHQNYASESGHNPSNSQAPPYPTGPVPHQMIPPPGQPNIVYVVPASLREAPTQVTCPNCKANVLTQTQYESGLATWLICGGICLFGLWCGCCLIPFCVDGCKDVDHYCPNCRALVGRYKRI